ncbi:MAG: acyl-CoA dehydratase activase-related protein [Phocaeicola sp.]|uniref:acyl-CoA dehydratase activase-related protein n=1 Tax=Phocaeicola sp. TaxID=2773926 RepID=UPI003FA0A4BF
MLNCYRIGLDVGSTTAKIVVLDTEGKIVYSHYERHNAQVNQLVARYFNEIMQQLGDADVSLTVTGSVGMATASSLKVNFVQEVVAATAYSHRIHPEAKALIDIGGEDAKVVFFNGKSTELRMNGNCAGGTGSFIDQMSVLMGISIDEMNEAALKATHVYQIAARCGVFSKTDIQNLMSRNVPETDIAASIFHAIAVQTVVTLSHGCQFTAPILLCGGPLTFLPALRKAFEDYLDMLPSDFISPENGNLIPAEGCALRCGDETMKVSELLSRLADTTITVAKGGLQPLFKDASEHEQWIKEKSTVAMDQKPFHVGKEEVVIGVDSGSTTTKVVAVRPNGDLVFSFYSQNFGNPIQAVRDGLDELNKKAQEAGTELAIVGTCSTGYGEELIKAAFNFDSGIIETMAHYRAASKLNPNVSFILDIGGQDMKAIFVEQGVVVRMELNEACSSGCGTFIQTFATNLGYDVEHFAKMACTAWNPCDLGTRCTVFMNSKVKQVLREGATIADISAGLAYSVVKNCLYKVLKLKSKDEMGKEIVVQGGTMRNDAVVRAFEILSGRQVLRGNMPELMGAYGCALHAISTLHEPVSIDVLLNGARFTTKQMQCGGCENHCFVTRYNFPNGNKFFSGNKCEHVFNNKGNMSRTGINIYTEKYKLLFDRPVNEAAERAIGIPRILNMYEDYPFWHRLLTDCGFKVVLSDSSTYTRYEKALCTVMSDNICFPAKLVHSHIEDLQKKNVERILMPYVVYEHMDDKRTTNSFNCPIVSGYSDVIKSVIEGKIPIDNPVITFQNTDLLEIQVTDYLKSLGIPHATIKKAFKAAIEAEEEYSRTIRKRAEEILEESRKNDETTIVLVGRPYHTDPFVQHKLSEMIASLGVNVISDDIVRGNNSISTGETYLIKQWAYMNRIVKAAQWTAAQDSKVHLVQMTSFGCGPDAFILDEVRDIMNRHNKPFTMLKIDDVSNIGSLKLRVRSLIESLQYHTDRQHVLPFVSTKVFRKEDRHRKILAPFFTDYLTPILPQLMSLAGYDVEILPQSDEISAAYGLQYANNEVCYPATLIVGDIIKALKSGKYDPNEIAFAMSQTGGQCRATNYASLIKRAMVSAGFADVPLITLGVSTKGIDNDQEGFDIPWLKYSKIIVYSLYYADAISKMYHATVVRECESGIAAKLRDAYMNAVGRYIMENDSDKVVELLAQAAKEFDKAAMDKECPKVGIVGEIFLKFNSFAHQRIANFMINRGVEVVPPILTPFFLQEFVNLEVKRKMHLMKNKIPVPLIHGIYKLISKQMDKINEVSSSFRFFRPFEDIYEEAKGAKGLVSLAAQFGEGWLLPSEIVSLMKEGVENVISLQPFGCIANHVVAKGIEKALHKINPNLNFLSLDFDSGVSSVNVSNRLLLFIDSMV